MFNYDWFHNGGLDRQLLEAKRRCAFKKLADVGSSMDEGTTEFQEYLERLDTRVILYMKDGLTYEMKEMAEIGMSSALAFECVPVDENYRLGAIVLVAPFEDIARIEVFAVHPDDKPIENFRIPGFRPTNSESGARQ